MIFVNRSMYIETMYLCNASCILVRLSTVFVIGKFIAASV